MFPWLPKDVTWAYLDYTLRIMNPTITDLISPTICLQLERGDILASMLYIRHHLPRSVLSIRLKILFIPIPHCRLDLPFQREILQGQTKIGGMVSIVCCWFCRNAGCGRRDVDGYL
jgi:hypothetical protein